MSGGSFDYLVHRESELLSGDDGGSLDDMIYWCKQIPELSEVVATLEKFQETTGKYQRELKRFKEEYHVIFERYRELLHDVEWCASSDINLDDLVEKHSAMKQEGIA